MRRALGGVVVAVGLSQSSCAAVHPPIALGQYDEFRPVYLRSGTRIELARPAYVAIIAMREPWEIGAGPLMFEVLYPQYDTDQLKFDAGRHHPQARRRTGITPINCEVTQRPTLRGCRPALHMYPGVRSARNWPADYPGEHVLLVASEEFIDPYELAYDLFYFAIEHPNLAQILRDDKYVEVATELERGILDRPGSPFWAGYLLMSK